MHCGRSAMTCASICEMPLVNRTHLVKAKEWARAPLRGETLREIAALRHALRAERYDLCIDLRDAAGESHPPGKSQRMGSRSAARRDAARDRRFAPCTAGGAL